MCIRDSIISVLSLHRSRGTKKAGQRARPVPHSLVQEIRFCSCVGVQGSGRESGRETSQTFQSGPLVRWCQPMGAEAPCVSLNKSESEILKARANVAQDDSR